MRSQHTNPLGVVDISADSLRVLAKTRVIDTV